VAGDDVTILMACGTRTAEVTAMSLSQAKQRIAAAWSGLFEPGREQEAAAFEVVMTELAESLEAVIDNV
jgi:hypothetical protein